MPHSIFVSPIHTTPGKENIADADSVKGVISSLKPVKKLSRCNTTKAETPHPADDRKAFKGVLVLNIKTNTITVAIIAKDIIK